MKIGKFNTAINNSMRENVEGGDGPDNLTLGMGTFDYGTGTQNQSPNFEGGGARGSRNF